MAIELAPDNDQPRRPVAIDTDDFLRACTPPSRCRWCGALGVGFDEAPQPADHCGHDPARIRMLPQRQRVTAYANDRTGVQLDEWAPLYLDEVASTVEAALVKYAGQDVRLVVARSWAAE
jgi:hypothetical protein